MKADLAGFGRRLALGTSAAIAVCVGSGAAWGEGVDCYDRALALPAAVSRSDADACHRKIAEDNTTNDRHAIALYNAARMYNALGESDADPVRKTADYSAAIHDLIESRDRAADDNQAFLKPWRKGNRQSQSAQMAANTFFVANRSYQLAKAYLGLAPLGGADVCSGKDACFERAVDELRRDDVARAAGAFREDYIYLRATAYRAWNQPAEARRDLEALTESPRFRTIALHQLGEIYLGEARRQLQSPPSAATIAAARASYRAALGAPDAALEGQLGVAETYMIEATIAPTTADRRDALVEARRQFALAISSAGQAGDTARQVRAYEGSGTAAFDLARLDPKGGMLAEAAADLRRATQLDASAATAMAQLKLARALALASDAAAEAAFTEAERRFGADPRAGLARAERAYFRGARLFDRNELSGARAEFQRALGEPAWTEGRADAYFFLSAIDLRIGVNAVADADAASRLGEGAPVYRQQACLARIAAGGDPVLSGGAMSACAGDDLLLGLFHLRQAQLDPSVAAKTRARRQAQQAFSRALKSTGVIVGWPGATGDDVASLAAFGSAVAVGCSSVAGMTIPADLEPARLDRAKAFFILHHVFACVAGGKTAMEGSP